jgi:hypothetical protein
MTSQPLTHPQSVQDQPSRFPQWKRSGLILLIIIGAVLLYHWRGLQPGYTFIPVEVAQSHVPWFLDHPDVKIYNPVVADSLYEHYPFLLFVTEELRAGRLPLWEPDLFMGHPAFADPIYQVFYPFWAAIALLSDTVGRGFALGIGFHVIVAALLTYALSRTLGHHRPAALVAAFTYAFGGFMVTWLEMLIWPATLTWLPGILLCYEQSLRKRSFLWMVPAALAYAFCWLGGQIQATLFFSLVWGVYAMGKVVEARLAHRTWNFFPILSLALSAILGILLATPLLLPFAEFLELSRRALSQGVYDALPHIQLTTFLIPNYLGNPQRGDYWGTFNYSEWTIYTGVVGLCLALAAPFTSRRFYTYFLTTLALVTLYVVIGGPGVTLLKELPVFKYLNLGRMAFIFPLYVALLAGELLSQPRIPRWLIPIISTILLGIVGYWVLSDFGQVRQHLDFLRPDIIQLVLLLTMMNIVVLVGSFRSKIRPFWQWGIVLLVFADLYLWGSLYNPTGRVADLLPVTPAIQAIQREQEGDTYRTVAIQRDAMLFGHNLLSTFNIPEPGGYSSIMYRPVYQVIAAGDPVNGFGTLRDANWQFFYQPSPRLLEVLQVSRVISFYPVELDDDNPHPPLLDDSWGDEEYPPLYYYEQKTPLPRSFVLYDSEVIADPSTAITRLMTEEFPIEAKVVVEQPLAIANQPLPATPATILSYNPQRIEIEVQASDTGLLVLGDVNYPGWRATVNGQSADVVTANVVWRGVVVPEGISRVVFTFEPQRLQWGFALAGIAMVGMVGMVVVDIRRKRGVRP